MRSDMPEAAAAQLLGMTIVVAGSGIAPSRLQSSFLELKRIVPEGWTPSDPPISMAMASAVRYQSRFTFLADTAKFQVSDAEPGGDGENSPIPAFAIGYLTHSGGFSYQAVGLNFDLFVALSEPERFLLETLIRSDSPLNNQNLRPHDCTLRLAYKEDDAVLNVSLDAVTATDQSGIERRGILIRHNFHTDLKLRSLEEVTSVIERFDERRMRALSIANTVQGLVAIT
jgi:hypothetical protein